MNKFSIVSAFLAISVSAAIAAETKDGIVTLPAQVLHYGSFPVAIEQTVPEMPASIANLNGKVYLQFEISESGRVSNIQVLNTTDDKLSKYSMAMVRRWEFSNPGEKVTAHQAIVFDADNNFPTLLALN